MEKQRSTAGTAGRGLTQSVPDPRPQVSQHCGSPCLGQVYFVNQPWYMLNIKDWGAGASIEIL